MALKLIAAPTTLAVDLADAKTQLRVDGTDENALITLLIAAATRAAEQELGRCIMLQTWELVIDAFPADEIRLEKPAVLGIESIIYTDTAGAQQTLDSGAYTLDPDVLPGYVLPAVDTSWPATADVANAVRVRFTAGYGNTPASVPENVRLWILMHVSTAYRMREAVAAGAVGEIPGRFFPGLLDAERVYL